jgi:hypothetical protein
MKKIFTIVLLLAVMGGAMAQNQGTREYVSALITFNDTNMLPQDTLNKYGVVLQTRSGRMANAIIDATKYQMFLNANLVERVQPSTRVFLRDEQVAGKCSGKCDHKGGRHGNREDVRTDLIPHDDILNDEARGWYLGFFVGGTNNHMAVTYARNSGKWYTDRGVDFEAVVGYQFNQWFGIRSGLAAISKNYITDLEVKYNDVSDEYRTFYRDMYLQLPLMADLSVGGEDVRIHFKFGGYAAYWLTQARHGYVYVANAPRPYEGDAYHFVEGYDNRFDAGLAGGIGLSLRVSPAFQLHFGGDYYHGLLSVAKSPYKIYNRTWTFGMGMTYHF